MSKEKEGILSLEVFFKNIIEKIAVEDFDLDKLAVIVLVSDTKVHVGQAWGINNLGAIERVDLVQYLIKNFEITLDDIEDQKQLKDENKLMQSLLKR